MLILFGTRLEKWNIIKNDYSRIHSTKIVRMVKLWKLIITSKLNVKSLVNHVVMVIYCFGWWKAIDNPHKIASQKRILRPHTITNHIWANILKRVVSDLLKERMSYLNILNQWMMFPFWMNFITWPIPGATLFFIAGRRNGSKVVVWKQLSFHKLTCWKITTLSCNIFVVDNSHL